MAIENDLLVSSADQKLPWRMPVVVNRSILIVNPFRLFYPKGNGKAPLIKADYRCGGKGICLVKNWSLAAWTPALDKRRRSTETEIGKQIIN